MAIRKNYAALSIVGLFLLAFLGTAIVGAEEPQLLPTGQQADRVVVRKAERSLTLYAANRPLATYQVALGQGGSAPKRRQGDRLTPEGLYRIVGRNPQSAYHLSLSISYPDAVDTEAARARGDDPGGDITIHGLPAGLGWLGRLHRLFDWTSGCIAVTNPEIEQISAAVMDGTLIDIRP